MSFRLPLRLLKLPSKRELAWQFLLSKAGARMRRLINLAIKISPTECLITTLNRKLAIIRRIDDSVYVQEKKGS